MKNYLILFFSFLLLSCSENSDTQLVEATIPLENEVKEEKPFSNPYLIYGSSFGNFFQVLYRQGDFNQMIAFTHSSSLVKHGREKVFDRYSKMNYNFKIDLHSAKKNDDSTYILNYTSNVIATRNILRMNICIENDTAKILLPNNLKEFPH